MDKKKKIGKSPSLERHRIASKSGKKRKSRGKKTIDFLEKSNKSAGQVREKKKEKTQPKGNQKKRVKGALRKEKTASNPRVTQERGEITKKIAKKERGTRKPSPVPTGQTQKNRKHQ